MGKYCFSAENTFFNQQYFFQPWMNFSVKNTSSTIKTFFQPAKPFSQPSIHFLTKYSFLNQQWYSQPWIHFSTSCPFSQPCIHFSTKYTFSQPAILFSLIKSFSILISSTKYFSQLYSLLIFHYRQTIYHNSAILRTQVTSQWYSFLKLCHSLKWQQCHDQVGVKKSVN